MNRAQKEELVNDFVNVIPGKIFGIYSVNKLTSNDMNYIRSKSRQDIVIKYISNNLLTIALEKAGYPKVQLDGINMIAYSDNIINISKLEQYNSELTGDSSIKYICDQYNILNESMSKSLSKCNHINELFAQIIQALKYNQIKLIKLLQLANK